MYRLGDPKIRTTPDTKIHEAIEFAGNSIPWRKLKNTQGGGHDPQ